MARKPDPARVYAARRAAIESNLATSGLTADDAERWLQTWEARAALSGMDAHDRDFWLAGQDWIATERRTGSRRSTRA